MAEIRISDMTTATSVNDTDLVEIAQVDGNSSSGYATKKTTILAIATKILKGISFSDLATTSKQIIAAINELKNNKIESSDKGTAGGVAELDSNGHVPASQLPSSVDDIVEGYYYDGKFYEEDTHETEIPAEAGKIYIDLASNNTYRWGGSVYVEISPSLSLGETSTTAYRGDRGKTAYDHATEVGRETTAKTLGLYKFSVTSEGHVGASPVAAEKSDFTALGLLGDIDNALSSTSENPVKNNALYSEFQNKANTTGTYAGFTSGKAQTVQVPVPSSVGTKSNPYMRRQIPYNTAEAETMQIVGATVNANQLVQNGNFANTSNWSVSRGTITVNNNEATVVSGTEYSAFGLWQNISFKANRIYLIRLSAKSSEENTFKLAFLNAESVELANLTTSYKDYAILYKPTVDSTRLTFNMQKDGGISQVLTVNYKNVSINDITQWFGSTEIPDKAYTMEQTESGSGIAWLKSQGFFNELYIGYRANGLESVRVQSKVNKDGNDQTIETIDFDTSKTLRGLFTRDGDTIKAVGDIYKADGTITRNYETRAYQSGDESLPDAITDGTTTVIKLTIPTTDTAAPFMANQVIDGAGTEEFTDYGVESGSRDFMVPPGNDSNYYAYTDGSMTIPAIPPADGDYDMKLHVSGGVRTFTWE